MRSRFTIYSAFLDINNSIPWYQDIHFLISRNAFLDIKNSISWYQEIIHISWYQKIEYPDIKKSFLDIKKSISWYQEMYSEAPIYYLYSISCYQVFDFLISRNHFLISRNIILDIKKWNLFLDIKKSITWYQEIHFLISKNSFLDIKNSISWYQEIHFLISRNIFKPPFYYL